MAAGGGGGVGPRSGAAAPPPPTLTQLGGGVSSRRLIGAEGSEFVAAKLKSGKPAEAFAQVQAACGLSHPLCGPLLTMLDRLGTPRAEAHLHILNRGKALLLDWLAAARAATAARAAEARSPDEPESREELELQEKLERLLNASFKYMGVAELKQVPIEVMAAMTHVPAPYLKQLAEEREIFNELPQAVKQQVYEYDRNLLQQDAVQFIAAYKYELGTSLAMINMGGFVRQRPRVCASAARGASGGGGSGGSMGQQAAGRGSGVAGAPLPKPGQVGRRGAPPARPRGFNMQQVLSTLGKGPSSQAASGQQQAQRTPLRTPPRSPSGAGEGGPLGPLLAGGSGGGRGASSGAAPPQLASRKLMRSGSEAIKQLRAMVGSSGKIYGHLVELCEVRLRESPTPYLGPKELSYCALRTQLLMSLHDSSEKGAGGAGGAPGKNKLAAAAGPAAAGALAAAAVPGGRPVAREKDFISRVREQLPREARSFKLAWLLDAALAQRRLTPQHMRQLGEQMADYLKPPAWFGDADEDSAAAAAARSAGAGRGRGGALLSGGGSKRPLAGRGAGKDAAAGAGSKKRRKTGDAAANGGRRGGGGGSSFEVIGGSDDEDADHYQQQQQRGGGGRGAYLTDEEEDEDDATLGGFIEPDAAPARKKHKGGRLQQQQQQELPDAAGTPPPGGVEDAEDVCGGSAARRQDRWLADAAMILRDPPTTFLLAAEVVDVLYRCLSASRLPADEPLLGWLLRLMALGAGARSSLRDNAYAMPPLPTKQLRTVWPELLALLASGEAQANPQQADLAAPEDVTPAALQRPEAWAALVAEYGRDEVLRTVVQMLVLDRLANSDLVTARRLLALMTASGHLRQPAALVEYAPFAFSLAQLLQERVKGGALVASGNLWRAAVDDVLLQLVDADSQVHLELLHLLSAAAKQVEPAALAGCLGDMLAATEASRRHAASQKRRYADVSAQFASRGAGAEGVPGYISVGGGPGDWSDGFRRVRSLKYGSSDGLSRLYERVIAVGGLQDKPELWPEPLSAFIRDAEARRQEEEAARRAERLLAAGATAATAAQDGGAAAGVPGSGTQ